MRSLTKTTTRATVALAAAAMLMACGKDDAAKKQPAPQAVAPAGGAAGAHAGAAAKAPGTPLSVTGEVVETMDASSYTYVRLKTDEGEVWAAGPQTKLAVGDQVTARDAMMMEGFESETLGRKFDRILFASALAKPGAAPAGGAAAGGSPHGMMGGAGEKDPHAGVKGAPHGMMGGAGMKNPHAGVKGAPHGAMGGGAMGGATKHMKVAEQKIEPVAKAGHTVAEIHADAGKLSGQKVAVRGVVAKFSPGIMGRNWVHIQDATGDPAKGTHDLTVTTQGAAKVGDTVLVEGKLATDKDFGAGYQYPVIVEEAEVKVEK